MAELEQRLRAAARALDATAPSFDAALLAPRRRQWRWTLLAAAAVAVIAGAAVQPDARSAVERFLGITTVTELGPTERAAPPFLGVEIPRTEASSFVPFPVEEVRALGEPTSVHGRYDVAGGMVSLSYANGVVLTEWPADRVDASVEVVASRSVAEDVRVAGHDAVWIAGEARGTFDVTGADGELHHETFLVSDGALTWSTGDVGYLLQGAGSKAEAVRLAASLG